MTQVKSIGSVRRVTLKETKTAKTSKRRRKRRRLRRRQNSAYRFKEKFKLPLWFHLSILRNFVNIYSGLDSNCLTGWCSYSKSVQGDWWRVVNKQFKANVLWCLMRSESTLPCRWWWPVTQHHCGKRYSTYVYHYLIIFCILFFIDLKLLTFFYKQTIHKQKDRRYISHSHTHIPQFLSSTLDRIQEQCCNSTRF